MHKIVDLDLDLAYRRAWMARTCVLLMYIHYYDDIMTVDC